MTEQAIESVKKQLEHQKISLDRQAEKLDSIQSTLQKIAVQDEQIREIQAQQQALWRKLDALAGSDGVIPRIQQYQASCPRKQIQVLWYVVIPLGLSQLALAAKLIEIMGA
jgi:butyrate kinase